LSRVGVVTGMRAEADSASAPAKTLPPDRQPLVFASGANAERAYEGARGLVAKGARALLSFGLSGALDPALSCGDIVLAETVILADGSRVATDAAWRAALSGSRSGGGLISGAIVGRDRVVATPRAKAELRLRTGAVAVDMESHAVAVAAQATGVPFMALRVVLDAADQAIPWSVLAGIGPDGRSRALPVAAHLLVRPWEIADLLALARANRRALATLGRLAAELGATFGFLV